MWHTKFIPVLILVMVLLSVSVLGVSCSSTEGSSEEVSSAPQDATPPEGMPAGRGFSSELLAEIAEILGIDQQQLEDAFNQAQSEMTANMFGDENPPSEPPEDMPPEGMSPGPGWPDDLLARVAEILGIDQQTLEDALAQVQSEMPEGPSGMPPEASPEE